MLGVRGRRSPPDHRGQHGERTAARRLLRPAAIAAGMTQAMNHFRRHVLAFASLSLGLLAGTPARAASLQKVNQSDWWAGVSGLPSYVNMYIYVPDRPATKPPIVVAPHHCQGTGQGTYGEMSSLVTIANTNGFIIIFPEATGQNCWDAGSTRSLKHDGGGDTGAVVQMVKYTLSKYSGDAGRVYSVGGSSGGIMTEALLGVYPDVFMAGVSLMGVPCGCWAQGYNDITGTGSTAQWSGSCAGGTSPRPGSNGVTWFVRIFPATPAIARASSTGTGRPTRRSTTRTWRRTSRSGRTSLASAKRRREPTRRRAGPPVSSGRTPAATRCTRRFRCPASGTRCRSTETPSPPTSASPRPAARIRRRPLVPVVPALADGGRRERIGRRWRWRRQQRWWRRQATAALRTAARRAGGQQALARAARPGEAAPAAARAATAAAERRARQAAAVSRASAA